MSGQNVASACTKSGAPDTNTAPSTHTHNTHAHTTLQRLGSGNALATDQPIDLGLVAQSLGLRGHCFPGRDVHPLPQVVVRGEQL